MKIKQIKHTYRKIQSETSNLPDKPLLKFSKINRQIGRLNFLIDQAGPCRLKRHMKEYRADLITLNNHFKQQIRGKHE